MDEKRRGATVTAGATTLRQEGLVGTIQEAVAEAVAEQEERALKAAQKPAKKRGWMSPFLLVVLLGFIASSVYSYFQIREMAMPLDEELGVEAEAVGLHLYSICMRLEQFREENGHYPASLGLMGLPADDNLEYKMVSDTEYRLEYSSDGVTRPYHSGQPPSHLLE